MLELKASNQTQIRREETARSMFRIILEQFVEHRMAVVGLFIVISFVIIALSADLISGWTGIDPKTQNLGGRYLKPGETTEASADYKETSIERWMVNNELKAQEVQTALINQKLVSTTDPKEALYELANLNLSESALIIDQLPTPVSKDLKDLFKGFRTYHPLGTDEVGRDVMMRLIYGTRVSMGVGVAVAIASALIGLIIGSLAGYYGGFLDTALMRITDALLSLPLIPVLIVIAAVDMQKVPALQWILPPENESIFKMFLILCVFSWMQVARLVRGSILSLREREFVLAAKTLGAKDSSIIFRHMFPNVIAPMLVSITLGVGESILFEAALSFLGLGIMPPTASWGNMLNNAQETLVNNPWLAIMPGLMILLTTISFNFLGDGLQDAVDPKSVRR